jgi:sphinganine C4-monooxygenase
MGYPSTTMAAPEGIAVLPPLPDYTLTPLPPLFPPIPDKFLALLLPFIAYWAVSMFFHLIDVNDYFAKYRLHTPAEILKRNHVSRYDVARDVIVQQIIQTIVGGILGLSEPTDFYGKEEYDLAVWSRRIRAAEHFIPSALAVLSIDANSLAKNLAAYPALAGALSGGVYPNHNATMLLNGGTQTTPGFEAWEMLLARTIYWVMVPAIQFFIAVAAMDTWQYFLHRAMHTNKWLYSKSNSPISNLQN